MKCRSILCIVCIALLLTCLTPTITIAKRTNNTAHKERAEIKTLIALLDAEDWKKAAESAERYLSKIRSSKDESLKARLRYIVIYATAGAVSTGDLNFDLLDKKLEPFVGRTVTLPYRPVVGSDCPPGGMNLICATGPSTESFMMIAANKTNTTIHAFEYVTLKHSEQISPNDGKWASVTGVLKTLKPNPNRSRAIVLRLYIDQAVLTYRAE